MQAAYNLTRKNPAIDWEIEMLGHLKNGNLDHARRCGLRAAEINIELARAPEVDARGATEHLIKAAAVLEQVKEYPRAADVYAEAVGRDPNPGTRIVEGRRVTSPLRQFDLETLAGREARGREILQRAAALAEARHARALVESRFADALEDAEFAAEAHARLRAEAPTRAWWRKAVEAAVLAGRAYREPKPEGAADSYELSRAAFERALTCSLLLKDDALFIDAFARMAATEAAAARRLSGGKEKWDAFRPMEFAMEAGVHFMVLGEFSKSLEMLELVEPTVMAHWKDQRGPTYYKLRAHLSILSGKREEAEEWRRRYRAEFERKERFDPEVVKPIHLEFDEEFYRMLGDEPAYRTTLIAICRALETGMREVFEGVDKMLEEGLYVQARRPLDELALESKDQRVWRLLSAYVNWRAKVGAGKEREGDARAFEDHMWHEIHPFQLPRQGLLWSALLETLGAEEDPIDLYPLPRTLALIHGKKQPAA